METAVAVMKIVLLGEPATGKSSLLVALYGALVNRRAGETRIVRTIDDVEFLSRGLQALGRRESVRRTEVDTHARLMIELAHNGTAVSMEMPDRSGELLKHMIDARMWDPELRRQLAEAAGAMLFLRADQLEHSAEPASDGHEPAEAAATSAQDDAPAPWTPAQMPLDVRAVDLLQTVLEERSTALPLAVIVSAWDRVGGRTAPPPPVWLAQHVSLLEQVLATHTGQLPHRVFGVSAQGGDFIGGPGVAAAAEDPWDRAFLIGPDGADRTLAEPIRWLIDAVGAA